MLKWTVTFLFLLQPLFGWATANEAVVIEVRKKVKLHDSERVYADYFIKGGTRLGLQKGVLVSVIRRVPVHDPFDNASVGDFFVKVADIEIIQADPKKSIGRLIEIDRREARPMLTYDAVMIGDRLDLNTMRNKVSFRQAPSSVFERERAPASVEPIQPPTPSVEQMKALPPKNNEEKEVYGVDKPPRLINESIMDSKQYFTLEISAVHVDFEDHLVAELFEIGAAGVQEDLSFEQKDKKYLPHVVEQDTKTLKAYFEETPKPERLESIAKNFPNIKMSLGSFPIRDWLAEWKAQWKPFELVSPFWIVPDWEKQDFDSTNKNVIFIEPGMAFGTGTHATTQIASQLISQLTNQTKISSAVDVGTGSGILTLLMHGLGVQNIFAYDNDSESKRVFLENLEKNKAKARWLENWAQELPNQVELCVANIIDGVLLELKPQFQQLKAQYYIFTGVLNEREKDFVQEMTEAWSLKLIQRVDKEEWVGFLFEAQS